MTWICRLLPTMSIIYVYNVHFENKAEIWGLKLSFQVRQLPQLLYSLQNALWSWVTTWDTTLSGILLRLVIQHTPSLLHKAVTISICADSSKSACFFLLYSWNEQLHIFFLNVVPMLLCLYQSGNSSMSTLIAKVPAERPLIPHLKWWSMPFRARPSTQLVVKFNTLICG